jgi:hypothetical protein
MAHYQGKAAAILQRYTERRLMDNERTLCIVCAWRAECQKKFLRGQDVSVRCSEFTKDISIKDGVKPDDKKEDSGVNT